MKNCYTLILIICSLSWLTAQDIIDQPSVGSSYAKATFYHLEDGSTTSVNHTTWDIAFNVEAMELGIMVNEGVGLSFTAPLPEVVLYQTSSTDFTTADTVGMSRIFNNEVSWSAGAFNHVANASDPTDYGWGTYDFMTHEVNSSRIFVIQLRNGEYKKIEITSLISGVYSFRYANLDGTNEVSTTIDKADYTEKTLAYYSIENETTLDLEPAEWDMVFTRYYTTLQGSIEYAVTGVLTNAGVQVAQADEIDPTTVAVDYLDYEGNYVDSTDAIGWDWKDYQGAWVLPTDLVYFVKATDEKIWMVQFIDFEGSSTGVTTLGRTLVDGTVSNNNIEKHLSTYQVFPNPASDMVNIVFDVQSSAQEAQLQIINPLGQRILNQNINIHNGLNARQLSLGFPSGMYQVMLQIGNDIITRPIIIQ